MIKATNTPKEIQAERWNKIVESHGAVNVLRGYLRDFLFNTDIKIGKKSKEELFDIAYGKLDAEDLEYILESTEQDLIEKEVQTIEKEKLTNQFKERFETENKDNIVRRYIDCIFSSYLDIRGHMKDITYDDSIINSYQNYLSRGDLNFLERLDLDDLEQLNTEFEKLVKNINIEEVSRMEKEIKKERKKKKLAEDMAQKKRLVAAFVNIFNHKRKLFQKIINLLDIKNKSDVGSVERYNKKFENFLNGFNIDDLRNISDLYSKVVKKTREMGGNEYDDEEYLLLGLEEFIKSKEKVA